MGLVAFSQHERLTDRLRHGVRRGFFALLFSLELVAPIFSSAQLLLAPSTSQQKVSVSSADSVLPHTIRSRRFLSGRTLAGAVPAARAMDTARQVHAAMLMQRAASSQLSSLSAPWQAVGPNQVASIAYGNVTGRVTAIAIDPADTTGNTVYLGTTGGGVWKSTNAAGPSARAPASR